MNLFNALILGVVQGVTEFLPISSSAHLALTRKLLAISSDDHTLLFDLACHVGTLMVLLLYFRKDIQQLLVEKQLQMLFYVTALLPLIPTYMLLKPYLPWITSSSLMAPGLFLTSLILFLAARKQSYTPSPLSVGTALKIGCAQVVALIPGISRSASTITAGLYCNLSTREAIVFSFLLSIPAILGGIVLEGYHLIQQTADLTSLSNSLFPCMIGSLTSFGCGMISIKASLSLLTKQRFLPLAFYCLGLSLILMLTSIV
ncbi:MAG: undecaprenyl-diphosphate phosphatase [Candidatus Rhabdochlamydia sp.]